MADEVAIVGSGIVGTAIAHALVQRGHRVALFEKGSDYPYPYSKQFQDEVIHLRNSGTHNLALDIRRLTSDTSYRRDLNRERHMWVGGSATRWSAIALRKQASEFRTKSTFGYGADWPLTYADLEPYYVRAEYLLGVSGTDDDNPFAPPRSKPFPMPAFELTYGDKLWVDRLKSKGIQFHTTAQARTRTNYDDRPACVNFGVCGTCPIGARYSPQHHLAKAMATGLVKLVTETSVRRVLVDKQGRVRALLIRKHAAGADEEYPCKAVIVAGGAIESVRLMLLSARDHAGPGFGNEAGWIGNNFSLHHVWNGELRFKDKLFHTRSGPFTAQSHQFLEPGPKGRHGGIKLGLATGQLLRRHGPWPKGKGMSLEDTGSERADTSRFKTGAQVLESMKQLPHTLVVRLASESSDSPDKRIVLSSEHDRFGDPVAHVVYKPSDMDHATYEHATAVFRRITEASGAVDAKMGDEAAYDSGDHHMGGCRMSARVRDGVVDSFCKVHGSPNLFVVGGSAFATSGSVNPTLTMVALGLRTADYLLDQVLR